MPRRAVIKDEFLNALDRQMRQSPNRTWFVRVYVSRDGQWHLLPNGDATMFPLTLDDAQDLEGWIVGHPLMGPDKNYRLQFFEPNNKGELSTAPKRQQDVSFADPSEEAASALANSVQAAQRNADTRAAHFEHEVARAAVGVERAIQKAEDAKALAQTDPEAFLAAQAAAKEELATMTDTLNSAREALAKLTAAQKEASIMSNARQTPLFATGIQALPGQPQPAPFGYGYQQPPPPYGYPPPGWYPPPQAPAQNDLAAVFGPMMKLLESSLAQRNVPAAPAGPDPEMRRLLDQQSAQLAEMKAQLAEARAEAKRLEERAEHQREMAELRAQMDRLANAKPVEKDTTALDIARMQADNARAQAESQQKMFDVLQRVQADSSKQMIDILQNQGSGDDFSDQARKLMGMQSEMFAQGMQVMRFMASAQRGSEDGEKAKAGIEQFAEKMMAIGETFLSGLAPGQGQQMQQPPPMPQHMQQLPPATPEFPPIQPPQMQAPQAPAPQQPHLQVVPAAPESPLLQPKEWVEQAREQMKGGNAEQAFRTLFAGFRQHPNMLSGRHELHAAQAIFHGHYAEGMTDESVLAALDVARPGSRKELEAMNASAQGDAEGDEGPEADGTGE